MRPNRLPLAAALTGLVALAAPLAPALAQEAETAPAPGQAQPDAPALRVELNRLEAVEGGCRIYLVLDNALEDDLAALQLDLVAFGADRVIRGRMAVDLAPLPGAKQTVRLFDWPQLDCDGIGRLLINDVPACATAAGPVERCLRRIETDAVGDVPLAR